MNKICIVKNIIIPFDSDCISVNDNKLYFLESGNYIIEYIDCNSINLDINISKDKCINLFEYSCDNDISINNKFFLDKSASLILNKFYCNKNCNENIEIYLDGEKSDIKYNFSSISMEKNKYKIDIYHNFNATSSSIYNKIIAKDNSSNFFDINSYVKNGILDTYIDQHTRIITLGDSNNRINPNMYTHDNSCTAVHSSTIGNVGDDELFYLMSRGISYENSIKLIVKGNILSNIAIPDEYYKKINNIIDNQGGE